MDSLTLLDEARTAGLEVTADGDRLVVRGSKCLEALAKQLLARKSEMLALLHQESGPRPLSEGNPMRIAPKGGGEPITVSPDGEPPVPDPAAKGRWLVQRDLDPASIKAALDTCLATEWGGVMPDVPQGRLLSRLNAWLEGQGRKPTTWPVMRAALGVEGLITPRRAVMAPCPRCGGTDWGDSGRREADGAEVWQCRTCPCPLSHAGRADV
jgi:hypothetical protein